MRAVAIIGRTCSGKSILASRLSSLFGFEVLGVGDLLRAAGKTDANIRLLYKGKSGFPDHVIEELVLGAVRSRIGGPIVIEGSIGLALALESCIKQGELADIFCVWLSCGSEIRGKRFAARQLLDTTRVETSEFFDEREILFDARMKKDIAILQRICSVLEVDCGQELDDIVDSVEKSLQAVGLTALKR